MMHLQSFYHFIVGYNSRHLGTVGVTNCICALFPQVSFEYMTRELLWHGFAEFVFFLLPFINFHRVRNFFKRRLTLYSTTEDTDVTRKRPQHLYKECAVCGEWPTCPRQIGCLHVFCYYCIQVRARKLILLSTWIASIKTWWHKIASLPVPHTVRCTRPIIIARLLWPTIRYPITQLLHWYLHRSNSTAPLKWSLLSPCSTYTATLLEYLHGYSKVTVKLLQRSSTVTSV